MAKPMRFEKMWIQEGYRVGYKFGNATRAGPRHKASMFAQASRFFYSQYRSKTARKQYRDAFKDGFKTAKEGRRYRKY